MILLAGGSFVLWYSVLQAMGKIKPFESCTDTKVYLVQADNLRDNQLPEKRTNKFIAKLVYVK